MFPIADENEPGRGPAFVTLAFIAINVAVFFLIQLNNEAFTYGYSTIPAEITRGIDLVRPVPVDVGGERVLIPEAPGPNPIYLTLLTSMFMHGGIAHIFGNMLFLWIFGDNVEHRVGHIPYALFYLAAGVIASFAQILVNPDSPIPSLGASGAISGVLGAYLVFFPSNRVWVIVFRFIPYAVPAIVAIGLWAVLQFINGFGSIAVTEQTGGVAYMAHIGGFIAGLVFGFIGRTIWGSGARGTPAPERNYNLSWR
ncbi:MAG TPA: rhomboid family intramembrane serine protease [Candidatus Limnocylindrales bacterium]|jgi:membrane associated rhomboid family serine protease